MNAKKAKALRKLAQSLAKVEGRILVEDKQRLKFGGVSFGGGVNHPNTARAKYQKLKKWRGKEPAGYIKDGVTFLHPSLTEELR